MILAAFTGLATMILLGWWLYDVDWRLGTAFVTFLVTTFVNVWYRLEK